MSLRAKLLAAIVFVNLLVLTALFYVLDAENERVSERADRAYREAFESEIPRALRNYASSFVGGMRSIERILDFGNFGVLCGDAILVDNPELVGGTSFMQLNPLGALHRSESFPRTEVLGGIERAMSIRRTVPVRGGYCMPIENERGVLVGGGWFLPRGRIDPRLPVRTLVLAFAVGVALLAAITYFGVDRWVLGPVARLSEAAQALERGEVGRQARAASGAPELRSVIGAFNRASVELAQHQYELARAVDEATERARRRERELVVSQRLAAIGTLAAGISHEINNPLAGMINAVNRLKKRGVTESGVTYVELLDEGLDRIRRIVSRTLDFAPRSREPLPFRLGETAERAKALVAHRLDEDGVRLEFEPGADGVVLGDSHELTQVFLNLFLNSLDALEDGLAADPHIRVEIERGTGEAGEPLLIATVDDNGPGCDPEMIGRIFDPFFSAKGATSTSEKISSGLGMSISFAIVEQHGGTMRARSGGENAGFHVELVLPRVVDGSNQA